MKKKKKKESLFPTLAERRIKESEREKGLVTKRFSSLMAIVKRGQRGFSRGAHPKIYIPLPRQWVEGGDDAKRNGEKERR